MSKGSKDYVMLKQETYTSLLITFLIFNQFSIQKSFGKLRLRPFQPYHPKVKITFNPFDTHSIGWYSWKGLSLTFMSPYSIFWRGQRPLYTEYTFDPLDMS